MVDNNNENMNEIAVVGDTPTPEDNVRETVSTDADTFMKKVKSKFLSTKKQKSMDKDRVKDPVANIAEGAMPVAEVEYNFTELIRFMEIYDLIRNSYINVIDAEGNTVETFDTDGFSSRDFVFNEYATKTFSFDIETVPVYKLTMPLSKEEMVFIQYKDSDEMDVISSKKLNKNTKSEFTSFELSDMLEEVRKQGFNLKSFVRTEVGETYAGKSKKGY